MTEAIDENDRRTRRLARRVLTMGVPLWAVLLVLLTAAGGVAWAWIDDGDGIDFGPAVTHAQQVRADVTMCNEVVDAEDINPRNAELDFEHGLRSSGARDATVKVHRRDCGD